MEAANLYFWNVAINDVIDAEEMLQNDENHGLRFLYEKRLDAFTLSNKQFLKNYRVTKPLAREIINLVRPYLQGEKRVSDIPIDVKVLVTLNFYGHGPYQENVGKHICHTLCQSSISNCIREVTRAFNQPAIMQRFVHFAEDMNQLEQLRLRFFLKYGFPGITGVVDCTHVAIVRPKENEEIYVNRKGYHSLNVQLVCDENLKIMTVNSRFPGSCHDSHIWRQSQISDVVENIYRQTDQPFFFLGDSGYPLRPWLLTPLQEAEPGPEERFQRAFTHIRAIIERCNGRIKNTWRCLLRHRVLHYEPEMAGMIVNACTVLHNMCIAHNIPEPDIDEVAEIDFGMYAPQGEDRGEDNIRNVNPDLAAARQLRRSIINNHFRE